MFPLAISALHRGVFDLHIWNFSKIISSPRILFRVWNIATISGFPIQSLLYYFTQVRFVSTPVRRRWSAAIRRHFILQQNKQAFNHSFSLELLSLHHNAPPPFYPIRATASKINIPRTALNIFPRLRVRNCLLRVASKLRNTRTPIVLR